MSPAYGVRQLRGAVFVALPVILSLGGCGATTPQATSTTAAPTATIASSAETTSPTNTPTSAATTNPTRFNAAGEDAATEIAIADGSLGMTVDEYIANYNRLDGDYPIHDAPEAIADQVSSVAPDGAEHAMLLFVTNTDRSLRSVTALSDAKSVSDEIDRALAHLEAITIWAAAAPAAIPSLTETESNNLLGTIGLEGGRDFGTYASAVDVKGVRYVLIETEDATRLIIREAN